jgi:hypothetical protein
MQFFGRWMDVGCNHVELAEYCVFIQYSALSGVGKAWPGRVAARRPVAQRPSSYAARPVMGIPFFRVAKNAPGLFAIELNF